MNMRAVVFLCIHLVERNILKTQFSVYCRFSTLLILTAAFSTVISIIIFITLLVVLIFLAKSKIGFSSSLSGLKGHLLDSLATSNSGLPLTSTALQSVNIIYYIAKNKQVVETNVNFSKCVQPRINFLARCFDFQIDSAFYTTI